uniref:IkappaB kinase n=1 Tax=Saccoglossus kowalevskii TaxID=10224 RepID=A0ABM0M026_SACKO
MAYNPHSDKKGDWHCEKVLGSGGFGTVRLWKHKKNNELLALKECRLMLDDKNKRRWNTEIAIMQRLDHTNVVKAIKVPDVLQSNDGDIPHLGMEYCSGGDLRHLLNSAENCCGLKENMVRDIILQITSGIEYLHSKRIIHRDLKPENIVLQNLKQNKIQYKIIDLGYAKALDDGSVCSSFVGTLQYLAPELFSSKEYTRTVDYWSFGTVVFECIVGFRPFLSMLQPAKWHGIVKKKSSEHICVFFDMNGQPQFSSTLPNPNYLCQPFKENIEKWLRLLLEWIPRKRGGKMDEITKQPLVFSRIDLILHQKIAHIYCIHTNTLLSYVVSGNKSMQSFQEQLTKDTGIPIEKQELLFPSGASIDPRQPSLHLASQQLD